MQLFRTVGAGLWTVNTPPRGLLWGCCPRRPKNEVQSSPRKKQQQQDDLYLTVYCSRKWKKKKTRTMFFRNVPHKCFLWTQFGGIRNWSRQMSSAMIIRIIIIMITTQPCYHCDVCDSNILKYLYRVKCRRWILVIPCTVFSQIRYLNPNSHLNFERHVVNRDTIA